MQRWCFFCYKHKLALLFLLLCCCKPYNSGYVFNSSGSYIPEIGKSTKAEVIKNMGQPTFTGIDDSELIYSSISGYKMVFIKTPNKVKKSLILKFDNAGILESKTDI